ncbi:MAG TPA: RNA 2',3'-cyclic phosphodiesterase [Sphingobacteriaceae bacterium]|nr:RNA 2',3'-cyclic phosphodiesterase [Sphingobacteriaceae bacterium]
MTAVRTFAALPISPEAAQALAGVRARWGRDLPMVRWVAPANYHITLQFFGDVEQPVLAELRSALGESLAGAAAFTVELAGLGAFPSPAAPRVLWAGCRQGSRELADLARRVAEAGASVGLSLQDRRFHPHVTLARLRRPQPEAWTRLAAAAEQVWGRWPAAQVNLYSSRLTPQGPIYKIIDRWPLS